MSQFVSLLGGSQILVSIVTQRLNTGLKLSGYLHRETTAIAYAWVTAQFFHLWLYTLRSITVGLLCCLNTMSEKDIYRDTPVRLLGASVVVLMTIWCPLIFMCNPVFSFQTTFWVDIQCVILQKSVPVPFSQKRDKPLTQFKWTLWFV